MRGVGHWPRNRNSGGAAAAEAGSNDTVNLGARATQLGIVRLDVPGIGWGPTVVDRCGISVNAEIGRVEKRINMCRNRTATSCDIAGRQCQVCGSDPLIESLRVCAVEMRGLIPAKVEVLLARLGKVEVVALIAVANVLAAGVDLVEAVLASGRHHEIGKRTRLDVAVFVVFGQAILAQIG